MSDTECRACNDIAADELRRCVRQMAQDGLDIDDATTAPVWTGKVSLDGVTHDVAEVVAERDRMREQSESWRRAAVAWQEWAARLTGDAALGDEAARAAIAARAAELESALRGLVEAAQVLASSHTEMHDNAILLETVDDPADRAICAARAALEVEQ